MSNGYEDIPGSTPSSSSKTSRLAKIAGVVVALLLVIKIFGGSSSSSSSSPAALSEEPAAADPVAPIWPDALITGPNAFDQPTTTAEAPELGWTKVEDEPCNPQLGEPYRKNGGVRSSTTPVTLYFTPDVGGVPGIISAIEVDYYKGITEDKSVEENLIGSYFSDEQTAADGSTFHSLAVALRDYDEHDLCDTSAPISHTNLEKITIAPAGAAENIPLSENDEELQTGWEQGSCIPTVGVHWGKDVVGGSRLTYEAANLVPVVPMYSSKTSAIQAVMFISTNMKQTFPEDCLGKIGYPFNMATTVACTEGKVNMWDQSPGVLQANQPPFYMCSNFCRADCELTGSTDGWYNTMHFVFKNITAQAGGDFEDCKGIATAINGQFCRPEAGPGQGV